MILRLFGDFAVQVDNRPAPPVRYRKSHWLLALLALQRGREIDRAALAALLWPDSSGSQALYNLRRSLAEMRGVLGPEGSRLGSSTPRTLALDLTSAQVDVVAFDAAISRGDEASLECAVELYRGPLLAQCAEEWILQERLAREEAYLAALETLAGHAMARGDPAAAVRSLRRAVAVDPLRETAQYALLKALVASEDPIGAQLAYRAFSLRLYQEIRAEPSPETKALFHQLRAPVRRPSGVGSRGSGVGENGAIPNAQRLTPNAPPAPRRLPCPLSQFVGRETALQAVEACLKSARLVTLTGPGGVGKTRLAIQVADAIADDYVDGVWFVDLTRLSEPALVPRAVASVLAVPEQPDRPLTETLAEFLRPKQLLLVLDNCEHLLSACAALVEALLSCSPELRILATSRQSLGLSGEVAWSLPGLSVPPPAPEIAGPTPEALLQFDAVRLFVERGRGATPVFFLTERSARSVGEICRRLDGIPLALELAAARLKALSVEEIAARLDDCFRLLTGGSRTALPRQQTLRATMDWSYALLSAPERLLLQRLSVFAASFTLEAVEAVCSDCGLRAVSPADDGSVCAEQSLAPTEGGARGPWRRSAPRECTLDCGLGGKDKPGEDEPGSSVPAIPNPQSAIRNHEVLDLLMQLVDQSLVVAEAPEGETRYRLLETVRQYAQERLRAGAAGNGESEEERVRRRHQEFYLRLAEEAAPHLDGPDQPAWLERLDLEHDNLRAALDWALEREPERALRLATAIAGFWRERGHVKEGRQRLAAALDRAGPERRSPAGAAALAHLGSLALVGDDFPAARAFHEESLALRQELGDPGGIAGALWGLGHVARRQEEHAEARALHEESLALRRALGDRHGIAQSLIGLADTLEEQGEPPSAWACYYEEALAISRELGDQPGVADALVRLSYAAARQGDYAQARRRREESMALWRALGSPFGVIHSLGGLGHLARDQGEYADARAFYAESLLLRRELGDLFTLTQGLEDFAELAAAEGEWARMTRLLGAAEVLREGMSRPLQPRERSVYEQYRSSARLALGEEATAAAWDAGRAMPLKEAVEYALQEQV